MSGPSRTGPAAVLDAIAGRRILVAGDFVLDRYVFGRPARLSREAPVLILEHERNEATPGGAGNAARNVRALGGRPIPLGVVGEDNDGDRLVALLTDAGIDTSGILRDPARPTVAKTRILAGGIHSAKQQVLRIDQGHRGDAGPDLAAQLVERADALLDEVDGVLLSDYGYSTLVPALRDRLIRGATERDLPSCADSRFQLLEFRGVSIATPNEEEASAVTGKPVRTDAEVDEVGSDVLEGLGARAVLLTRGSHGMRLFMAEGGRDDIAVVSPEEVTDVTGAGDTVASALVLGLASGADVRDAARVANAAASVVVMRRGAATASPDEVRRALGVGSA